MGTITEITKMLISGNIKFKEGQIVLMGEKVFLLPVSYFAEETRRAMKEGMDNIMDIYWSAWVAGYHIMKNFVRGYKLKKFEERYKVAMDVLQLAGMGFYETINFKRGEYTYFKTRNNPLAQSFFPSKKPICHFIRGANAGGGVWVHETIMNCLEEECESQNHKECVFLNATIDVLRKRVKSSYIKKQFADIDSLIERQKEFVKRMGDEKVIKI
ncbi:MAG: hypothetical protein JSV92_01510 [archaeon]|nr:MAG: hypothetical protein JSV92_01510 [archaeon]